MTDVRLVAVHPDPGPRRLPIAAVRFERSLDPDSLGWTPINPDPIPVEEPQELVLQQVDPGTHWFRAIAIDEADQESFGNNAQSVTVAHDAPQDPELTVELTL